MSLTISRQTWAFRPALVPAYPQQGHPCAVTATPNGIGMVAGAFVPATSVEGSPPRGTGLT